MTAFKITSVQGTEFNYPTRRSVDTAGHAHPGPLTTARMAMLTITTEGGHKGYAFGAPQVIRPFVLESFAR